MKYIADQGKYLKQTDMQRYSKAFLADLRTLNHAANVLDYKQRGSRGDGIIFVNSFVNSTYKGQWRGALMFFLSAPEQTIEQTIETLVIWNAIALIMASL